MTVYVVYHGLKHYGGAVVLERLIEIGDGMFHRTGECVIRPTLGQIRDCVPDGLLCFPRKPEDHPYLIEMWK